ncbi:unnamed protein product [Trichobilharzia szidati]|nr:unnamed protein product [Trichobilharzia szidati]
MSRSALEMNFMRLLYCTECLAVQKKFGTTYKSYVKTLETFFNKLTSSNYRPSPECIRNYEIRVKKLKENCDIVQTSDSASTHYLSHDKTTPALKTITPAENSDNTVCKDISSQETDNTFTEIVENTSVIQCAYSDTCDLIAKERQRINRDLREQLLGGNKSTEKMSDQLENSSKSPDALLHEQQMRREQLASEMLLLTVDLKNQSSAMNQRIRSDCQTVNMSIGQAEKNEVHLSGVLNELSVELGSKCGRIVWILFFISLGLFLYMILFMKMFRKRIHYQSAAPQVSRNEL